MGAERERRPKGSKEWRLKERRREDVEGDEEITSMLKGRRREEAE